MAGRLMEPATVTVAEKSAPKKGKREMTNVSIAPVSGINGMGKGFKVTQTYAIPTGKGWNEYENEEAVVETREAMDKIVDRIFGTKD